MNHVARALGLDAAEIRRRNLVRPRGLPLGFRPHLPGQHPVHPPRQRLSRTTREGARRARLRWYQARPAGGARAGHLPRCLHRLLRRGHRHLTYEGVEVRVEPTGHVHVTTGYPSQGQGHHTTLTQIVAETLAVPPEQVVVESGRSDRFAWGVGTFASRAAVVGGSAALGAAKAVRDRALDLASEELEAAPEDLVLADGAVHVKGASDGGHAPRSRDTRPTPSTRSIGRRAGPPRRRLLPLPRRCDRQRGPRRGRGDRY